MSQQQTLNQEIRRVTKPKEYSLNLCIPKQLSDVNSNISTSGMNEIFEKRDEEIDKEDFGVLTALHSKYSSRLDQGISKKGFGNLVEARATAALITDLEKNTAIKDGNYYNSLNVFLQKKFSVMAEVRIYFQAIKNTMN